MPEQDIYLKREQEAALSTFRRNRDELLNFYKSLGQLSREKIPKKLKDEETSRELAAAESVLKEKIRQFSKLSLGMQQNDLDSSVGRLAIAMFLIERTKKLREIVLKTDNVSLFSLYLSLRAQVCGALDEQYYSKTPEQVINDYLDIDPLLCACSELCGLSFPPLGEIVVEYKRALADEISKMDKGPGAADPPPEKNKTRKAPRKKSAK